jgi:hypothetical protein
MEWFFAGVTLALLGWALRDELRAGGLLHWRGLVEDAPEVAVLIDLPRAESWTDEDVIRTYAEIQAL